MATAQAQPALTPSGLNTFLQSFAQALARADATGSPQGALARSDGSDEPLLTTSVTSAQAPQVGAFLPVQAPFSIDASSTNAPQSAPTPTSSASVDPNAVVDQILKGAFLRTDGSSSSVRLNLVPESLGSVTVNLHVDGSSVNATVVAQTPDARDALLAGQNQLARSLADAGMKLASFTVNLAGGGFSGFQQQQHHSLAQDSSAGRNARGNVGDATDVGDAVVAAIPTFGPPLVASSNAGLYNYLA
jgi:flagellar hook-length control protein FliK